MSQSLTLEQFFQVDQDRPYPELIDGVVLRKPFGGTWSHSAIQTYLMLRLGKYGRHSGLGRALPQLHCVVGDLGREQVLCPDVAYVIRKHLMRPAPHLHGYHSGPPDIAIEVAMDEESASRLAYKAQLYLAHGARAVWIPDPDERAVYVLRGGADLTRLVPGDRLGDPDLLPGLAIEVDDIFAEIEV